MKRANQLFLLFLLILAPFCLTQCCGTEEQRAAWKAERIKRYQERVIRSDNDTLTLGYQGEDFYTEQNQDYQFELKTVILAKDFRGVKNLILQHPELNSLVFDLTEITFEAALAGKHSIVRHEKIQETGKSEFTQGGLMVQAHFSDVYEFAKQTRSEKFINHILVITFKNQLNPQDVPTKIRIPIRVRSEDADTSDSTHSQSCR